MKLTFVLVPALLAASAVAHAERPKGRWHEPISIEQVEAETAERFAASDSDGDGQLTPDEFFSEERQAARIAERKERMFGKLDKDRDGLVSQEEFSRRTERLRELDTNGDGKVSRDERRGHFGDKQSRGWRRSHKD